MGIIIHDTLMGLGITIPALCNVIYVAIAFKKIKLQALICKISSIVFMFFIIIGICRFYCFSNTTETETEKFEIVNIEEIENGYTIVYTDENNEKMIQFKNAYNVYDIVENTSQSNDYVAVMTEEVNSPKIIQMLAFLNGRNMLKIYTSNKEMLSRYNRFVSISLGEVICLIVLALCWVYSIYILWRNYKIEIEQKNEKIYEESKLFCGRS